MKQNQFSTAIKLCLSALAFIFAVISCTKKSNENRTATVTEEIASARTPNASTVPTVSLKVTVNNEGNKITSDGLGDYVNGLQRVEAILDKYGNFNFRTNTNGAKPAIRSLNYNFDDPVIVYNPPPEPGSINGYWLTTSSSTLLPNYTPIQNLSIGQSECVQFYTLAGNWRLLFHAGFQDRADSTTAYAYITRTSSTQWTFTSAGTCLPACVANKAAYNNAGDKILYGHWNMPFSFTLTKL